MSSKRYTEDHEWVEVDGDIATIGISEYAQGQLGDIVFVELPEVGATFDQGDELAVVESVKAASEIYAPVSGEVIEVNESLVDAPEQVNDEAEGEAWFVKIRLSDPAELDSLMTPRAYKTHIADLD